MKMMESIEKLRDERTLEHACAIGVEGLRRVIAQNWNTRKYCSAECAREHRNRRRREEYREVRR